MKRVFWLHNFKKIVPQNAARWCSVRWNANNANWFFLLMCQMDHLGPLGGQDAGCIAPNGLEYNHCAGALGRRAGQTGCSRRISCVRTQCCSVRSKRFFCWSIFPALCTFWMARTICCECMLLPYALGECFGPILWSYTLVLYFGLCVGLCFGPMLWAYAVGLFFGPMLWAYALGLSFRPILWAYPLGLSFRPMLWAYALGLCFGHMLWAYALGICFGLMLWAYALGVYFELILWTYALGLCFGHMVWAYPLGLCFGCMRWAYYLGISFEPMLWAYALGVCFGCLLATKIELLATSINRT